MKRLSLILIPVCAMLLCCACAPLHSLLGTLSPEPDDSVPGKLVEKVQVCTVWGSTVDFATYTAQEEMSPILRLLRQIPTREDPETEVTEDSSKGCYTITTTYYNGSTNTYTLTSGQYIRSGDAPWKVADSGKYAELEKLLAEFAAPEEPEETSEPTEDTTDEESTG